MRSIRSTHKTSSLLSNVALIRLTEWCESRREREGEREREMERERERERWRERERKERDRGRSVIVLQTISYTRRMKKQYQQYRLLQTKSHLKISRASRSSELSGDLEGTLGRVMRQTVEKNSHLIYPVLLNKIHQKGLNHYICNHETSASGGLRSPDPYQVSVFSKLMFFSLQLLNIDFFHMNVNLLLDHIIFLFIFVLQICTKMYDFTFDISKTFSSNFKGLNRIMNDKGEWAYNYEREREREKERDLFRWSVKHTSSHLSMSAFLLSK